MQSYEMFKSLAMLLDQICLSFSLTEYLASRTRDTSVYPKGRFSSHALNAVQDVELNIIILPLCLPLVPPTPVLHTDGRWGFVCQELSDLEGLRKPRVQG